MFKRASFAFPLECLNEMPFVSISGLKNDVKEEWMNERIKEWYHLWYLGRLNKLYTDIP